MELKNNKLTIKVISFMLALSLAFFTCMPKSNTFIDDLYTVKQAHAVPLVPAVMLFGTLLSVAGVAVAGTTAAEYNANLLTAFNDFATSTGTTIDALSTELSNAITPDGKILLSLLTAGAIPNILSWINNLSLTSVESSLVDTEIATIKAGSLDIPLRITSDDLSQGLSVTGYTTIGASMKLSDNSTYGIATNYNVLINVTIKPNGKYNITHSNGSFVWQGVSTSTNGSALIKGSSSWNNQQYAAFNLSTMDNITFAENVFIKIVDETVTPSITHGILEASTGIWSGYQDTYTPINQGALGGAVSGSLSGGIAAGGTTVDQLAPSIGVWTPTADQLTSGYTNTDVMTGTGALEGSTGGSTGGDTEDVTLLQKILAGILALGGIATLPTIVTGVQDAINIGLESVTGWFENVWGWISSLNLPQWLSDVWGWLSSLNFVTLLSPLAALLDWVSSLGLSKWLVSVWEWIAALDIAGALAGILEGILNFPNFVSDWFSKPTEKFDWSKLMNPDLLMIFPFCLAWDLYNLVTMLSASATAPYVEIPINTPVGNNTVVVDLSQYDGVASVLRAVELLAAAIGLIFLTKKFIRN